MDATSMDGFAFGRLMSRSCSKTRSGVDFVRDDVRLGGAVADTGPHAADSAKEIGELIESNREDVSRVTKPAPKRSRK